MAAGDQPFDDRRSSRQYVRSRAARRSVGRQPSAATSAWKIAPVSSVSSRIVDAALGGARVDLVVDVGDVADIGHMLRAIEMAQQAEQNVEDDERPRIADMGAVIDRRAADIHAHIGRIERHKGVFAAGQRIVEPKHGIP